MAFGLQLGAAVLGNFDTEVRRGRSMISASARKAMADTAQEWQSKLRQDLASSGLARGVDLQKTWRMKVYAPGQTMKPAALIYSTMPKVVMAFEKGATVTVNGKRGALVPNPAVWGEGRVRRPSGRSAKGVSTFAVALRRFGGLQFIPTRGNGKLVGVFVAKLDKGLTKKGARRKAGVRALKSGKFDRLVVFWVVHEPRLPRLLRGNVIRERAEREAPAQLERRFLANMNSIGRGQAALPGPGG